MKASNVNRLLVSLAALLTAGAFSASCSSDSGAGASRDRGGTSSGGAGTGGFGAIGTGGSGAATGGSIGVGGSSGSGMGGSTGSGASSGSAGSVGTGGNGGWGALGALPDGSVSDADFVYDAPQVQQDACAAETARAEKVPLDIYVMYDQSGSMGCPIASGSVTTRWMVVTPAFQQFLSSPQAAGIGVGIQYFGQGIDCNAALYFNPDVPIAPLPGNLNALNASLAAHPQGLNFTTTNAAMIGAIGQAQAWKNSHPSHVVAVLLVTDGQPNACGTVQDTVNTTRNGVTGTPSIRTFVLGIVAGANVCGPPLDPNPPNVPDLDAVAAAGGTNRAYIIDPAASGATQQLLDALNNMRATLTVPCQYVIPKPSGGLPDTSQVAVMMTPGGGAAQTLTKVDSQSACTSAGGWYFDNNNTPTAINLCPSTCNAVTGDTAARIDVTIGCIRG